MNHLQRFVTVCAAVLGTMDPLPARAQGAFIKENAVELMHKVGVHVNMSVRDPVDPDVTKGRTFGVSLGISPGRTTGWRYPVGVTLFSQNLHSPNGEPFAAVRTFAIMGGVGYGWHVGRLSTGVSLQTGYAFNHGRVDGDMPRAFGVPNGSVSVAVDDSFLLRPELKAEYFITPRFTFRASADYMRLRPEIAAATPNERLENRWSASSFHANIGFGFYPFREK